MRSPDWKSALRCGYSARAEKFACNNDMTVGQGCSVVKAVFTFDALALVQMYLSMGTKQCCFQTLGTPSPVVPCSARVQALCLIFWCEYLEKRYVHISAQQESHSGTMLDQQA